MTLDAERAAVYAAELAAFDGTDLELVIGFQRVAARLQAVTSGTWWPGPHVDVRRARVDAQSSSTRCAIDDIRGRATIRLADSQSTMATGAHELAHALAGIALGHGGVFRSAYLDVIAVITNFETTDRRLGLHVEQLAVAFADGALAVEPRRWRGPPSTLTSAIAL